MQQDTANVNTDDLQAPRRFDGNKQFHIYQDTNWKKTQEQPAVQIN